MCKGKTIYANNTVLCIASKWAWFWRPNTQGSVFLCASFSLTETISGNMTVGSICTLKLDDVFQTDGKTLQCYKTDKLTCHTWKRGKIEIKLAADAVVEYRQMSRYIKYWEASSASPPSPSSYEIKISLFLTLTDKMQLVLLAALSWLHLLCAACWGAQVGSTVSGDITISLSCYAAVWLSSRWSGGEGDERKSKGSGSRKREQWTATLFLGGQSWFSTNGEEASLLLDNQNPCIHMRSSNQGTLSFFQ